MGKKRGLGRIKKHLEIAIRTTMPDKTNLEKYGLDRGKVRFAKIILSDEINRVAKDSRYRHP